jgi:hypothetical protein
LLLLVPAVLVFCAPPPGEEAGLEVRRIQVTPEQLEQELRRVKEGVFVQMLRTEFEEKLRGAQRQARRNVPVLAEARYRARLDDSALIGSGQWKVVHSGPAPALLPLEPFNLAVRQVRFENRDAILGDFEGRTPALLIEEAGEHTANVEWSARGELRPDGIQFDLKFPPTPLAVLELDLPADRAVVPLDATLVAGPQAAEAADRRLWKVFCGGRTQVNFVLRPASHGEGPQPGAPGAPLVLVQQRNTQRLTPEGLEATFALTVEVGHPGLRRLVLALDPELRLREVTAPDLEGYDVGTAPPGQPVPVTVRLRSPLREGTVVLSCLAPLEVEAKSAADDAARLVAWRSPGVHLPGGAPRGETLELWLHPDLRVEGFQPGGFRLIGAGPAPGKDGISGQRLTLIGGGIESGKGEASQRPQLRCRAGGVAFQVRQLTWWDFRAGGMQLTLYVGYEVTHGQLFQLALQVPSGWDVESVKLSPARLLRNWSIRTAGKGPPVLQVELERPLTPEPSGGVARGARGEADGPSALAMRDVAEEGVGPLASTDGGILAAADSRGRFPELIVDLRPARAEPLTGRDLPFPDAVPLGAHVRDSALAVEVDGALYASTIHTVAEPVDLNDEGPWRRGPPTWCYRFLSQPPAGHLRLEARRPQVRARCSTDVLVAAGQAAVQTRLRLDAEAGVTEAVDVHITGQVPEHWSWREEGEGVAARGNVPDTSPVRKMERRTREEAAEVLAALAAATPLEAAVLAAARPPGQRWRLSLARPLRTHEPLHLFSSSPLLVAGGAWAPPLLVVSGARTEGEVTLHLGSADLVEVESTGLREGRGAGQRGSLTAWRTYRYGPAGGSLLIRSSLPARAAGAIIDHAALTTYLVPEGLLQHRFVFRVSGWQEDELAVQLPAGARLRAAQVDGRWINDTTLLPDRAELRLPVPRPGATSASAAHVFELLYTTPAQGGWLATVLEAPAPRLPIEPAAFQRSWRLPPEIAPLFSGRLQRWPGGGDEAMPVDRDVGDLFRLPGAPPPWPRPAASPTQLQAIADAAQALRGARRGPVAPTSSTLGEAVEVLAFEHLRGEFPLVVDTAALTARGLLPATPLAPPSADRPLWEGIGVVVIPAGNTTLLTTVHQLSAWRRTEASLFADMTSPEVPPGVLRAAAQAARRGQDSSGRFRLPLLWLRPEAVAATGDAVEPVPFQPGLDPAVWAEWVPVAGSDEATLTVVDFGQVRTAAFFLTALLILAGWRLRRRHWRLRLTLLLIVLGVAGVGLVWLPGTLDDFATLPLATGCVLGLAWFLWVVRRHDAASRRRGAATTAAGVVAGMLLGWRHLPAPQVAAAPAAPGATTVYLLPAETEEKQMVLVPADFAERLKTLSQPAACLGRRAVLLSGSYEGKIEEGAAEFNAVFAVHCGSEAAVPLLLPLDGVQLVGDVWLDGARAHPVAGPEGYLLQVKGTGRHKVELRFRADVQSSPEDQLVAATLPPLLQARLEFHFPGGAAFGQTVAQGAVREVANGPGKKLEADLGRIRTMQVRWSTEKPGTAPHVEFRAAHLWDLRLEGSTLQTLIRYQITQVPAAEVDVVLPPGLEVQGVTVSRPQGAERAAIVPRLRERRLEDRRLRLLFATPVAGSLDVLLELTPRAPLPPKLVLPLPVPQGTPLPGDSYLAYRLQGLEARRGQLLGVTGIRPEDFAPFWPSALRPHPRALAYACTVAANAVLELHLHHPDPIVDVVQEVKVQAGLHEAQVRASATLTVPRRDLAFVEWELHSAQPLTVLRVSGPNVRSWAQAGDRALVWLNRTAEKVDLELSAWVPLPPAAGLPAGEARLELPCLRLHPVRSQQTTLRIAGLGEVVATPVEGAGPHHLDPVASQPAAPERVYRTRALDYGGAFVLRPLGSDPPLVKSMTVVEAREGKLTFAAVVEYRPSRGELRRVAVRLRHWEGEDDRIRLETPRASRRRYQRGTEDRTWFIDLQPGFTGTYQLTLSGEIPLDEASAGTRLPEVTVPDAAASEAWVAVTQPGLLFAVRGPLEPILQPGPGLQDWPKSLTGRLQRGGVAWKVAGPDWQVRLTPQGTGGVGVRVLLCDRTAAVIDHRHWLHEAVYWVAQETPADLNVVFPAEVRILHVSVDGVDLLPVQPGRRGLWLPLSGRGSIRQVRLRWQYDPAESLADPNLARLRLDGVIDGPTLWTVSTPVGWEVAAARGTGLLGEGPGRIAAVNLHRASVQLQLSRALAKSSGEMRLRLREAQRRFFGYCNQAARALAVGGDRSEATGPGGRALPEWLASLHRENRAAAKEDHIEDVVAEAERRAESGGGESILTEAGAPHSWYGPSATAPQVHLKSTDAAQAEAGMVQAGRWVVLLGVIWLVAMIPFLAALARRLWPEFLAAAGLWGWYLAGPTVVALLLLFIAACGRLLVVLHLLRRRLHRRAPSTSLKPSSLG